MLKVIDSSASDTPDECSYPGCDRLVAVSEHRRRPLAYCDDPDHTALEALRKKQACSRMTAITSRCPSMTNAASLSTGPRAFLTMSMSVRTLVSPSQCTNRVRAGRR
ncbi:hypothetical protein AB0I30_31620 [Nocardia tengchongensis]|uniref:hypothetical protein n=1 Tax=Nocardia tengchongensis TaxID=2055889 RepID=UPI0033EA37D7